MRRIWKLHCFLMLLCAAAVGCSSAAVASDADDFFERRVRPVLAERCFKCHGERKQESGLRLDRRRSLFDGGDSGPAAVSGRPEASLLIQRIRAAGDQRMPPDQPLTVAEIDALSQWIRDGVVWPGDRPVAESAASADQAARARHWAFQRVQRPPVPGVSATLWPKSDIDRFVLARLEDAQLGPAGPADARVLIRRVTLDLTGLPPSPDDVDAFVAASQSDPDLALRELVDRLLDSPQYGVRWGRLWLDVARYADNKGYVFFEENNFPWSWTYRDWVIDALNRDLPYDDFVRFQIAADRMQEPRSDGHSQAAEPDLAALGFLTLGARFMGNTHDVIDDRIDVVTRGLMGVTVSCARCHDHKFDPFSQADYYGLYGVFRSSQEPMLRPLIAPPPDSAEYRDFDAGLKQRVSALDEFVAKQRELIMDGARRRADEYLLAVHQKRNQPGTENFMLLTDQGAIIPAIIQRWETYLKRAKQNNDPVWTIWLRFSEIPDDQFSEQSSAVYAELIERVDSDVPVNPLVREAFAACGKAPVSMAQVADLYGALFQTVDATGDGSAGPELSPEAAAVRHVLYGDGSPPMVPTQLGWGFLDLLPDRPTQGEFKKLIGEIEKWSSQQTGYQPRAMSLVDAPVPYEPVVFLRGDPNREGPAVPRRFPTILAAAIGLGHDRGTANAEADRHPAGRAASEHSNPASFRNGSGRLELAEAIVDPKNPLTARVLVNRIWQQHFGTGLVETSGDFGLRSNPPSHPELLDWLASEFVARNWSLKALHRLILNSATYRQSSHRANAAVGLVGQTPATRQATPKTSEPGVPQTSQTVARERTQRDPAIVDPRNRLLWTFPRRRLDFESTRDALLAISGSLNVQRGGPPVQLLSGFNPRRTVFGFVDRMNLPGLLRTFDYPEPAATSPRREVTTVPPQALFFLNHEFVAECARRAAKRTEALAPDARIEHLYRLLFSRAPDDGERALALDFLDAAPESIRRPEWKYGFGGVDDATGRVNAFTELTWFTGTRWQAGPNLPDPVAGWVFHDRTGGHPASSADRCCIRRWTSPVSGNLNIRGRLAHRPEPGNGVRARLVSSRDGVLGEWRVDHSEAETRVEVVQIEPGDTLDFVVDWQGEILHDEFEWPVVIEPATIGPPSTEPVGTEPARTGPLHWDSAEDFAGEPSDRWAELAHALLMTNEFVFVD